MEKDLIVNGIDLRTERPITKALVWYNALILSHHWSSANIAQSQYLVSPVRSLSLPSGISGFNGLQTCIGILLLLYIAFRLCELYQSGEEQCRCHERNL